MSDAGNTVLNKDDNISALTCTDTNTELDIFQILDHKKEGVEPSAVVARDASAETTAMDLEDGLTALDKIVTQFNTYENYLDSQITDEDLYYLEDEDLARQLVELGGRGTGKVVKRGDFEARKATIMAIRRAAIEAAKLAERTQKKTLTSTSKELQDNFLKALAVREEDNRNGKVSVSTFHPTTKCVTEGTS
ncbi:cilia- and flagella-associated protein 299 [Phyllostomus hastatus]|uniref:cilia- and flagella-associated protein 299 n=1 Tax=Phyllostomus hastatus TaxID=9423 RepID=UPI001E68151E|nr:cilia- and flagella-associated protein 299 [Phyllostomus hastatus]